jgi:hypothetical protein
MLNQLPRNSWHVSRLPCKDVPIFLEKFDEHEFLFGIQIVAYVSNLGRFFSGQQNCLTECILQLDGCLGGLLLRHDRVWGDSAKACFNSWSSTDGVSLSAVSQLSVTIKSPLGVSPDGDDATRPCHLQDQVSVIWDRHELGECQPSQERVVRNPEIRDLKLYSLHAENFLSPEGYRKRDLANGGHCYTRDCAMERRTTGVQQRPGYAHLVESL